MPEHSANSYHKLDNPVWHSLSESHRQFALEYGPAKFYHPDYCPFGAFVPGSGLSSAVEKYGGLADNFFIVGNRPDLPIGLSLKNELVCLQMIRKERISTDKNTHIVKLNSQHQKVLFDLVNLVQPGYFRKKTALLGDYFGIFDEGKLVAVTGERMKMDIFTEVSAVVTHPDYLGKGFAGELVSHTVNKVFEEYRIPFLHVAETNIRAIRLYEKLGFIVRRRISFWNLAK